MKPALALPCLALLFATPLAARADQFAYLDIKQAVAALRVLDDGQPEIRKFCAPCNDQVATPVAVDDIGIDRVWHWDGGAKVYTDDNPAGYWEVVVNGDGIDLAYIYVRRQDGRWENLAMRIGLEPSDVPRNLPDPGPNP